MNLHRNLPASKEAPEPDLEPDIDLILSSSQATAGASCSLTKVQGTALVGGAKSQKYDTEGAQQGVLQIFCRFFADFLQIFFFPFAAGGKACWQADRRPGVASSQPQLGAQAECPTGAQVSRIVRWSMVWDQKPGATTRLRPAPEAAALSCSCGLHVGSQAGLLIGGFMSFSLLVRCLVRSKGLN